VLSERLNSLVGDGIVTRRDDPTHAQKAIYSLTDKGLALLPVLIAMSRWSRKYDPATRRPEAVDLVGRGAKSLKRLEAQLRRKHGIS